VFGSTEKTTRVLTVQSPRRAAVIRYSSSFLICSSLECLRYTDASTARILRVSEHVRIIFAAHCVVLFGCTGPFSRSNFVTRCPQLAFRTRKHRDPHSSARSRSISINTLPNRNRLPVNVFVTVFSLRFGNTRFSVESRLRSSCPEKQ